MRYYGMIKRFRRYNNQTGKENNFGFIERPYGSDVFVHQTQLKGLKLALDRRSLEGLLITFEKSTNVVNGVKKEHANDVLYIGDETDTDVLAEAFLANCGDDYETLALERLCELLQETEVIELIEQKIDLQPVLRPLTINISEKLIPHLLSDQACRVRQNLNPTSRLRLYPKSADPGHFASEILACRSLVNDIEWKQFINKIRGTIQYDTPLFDVAPDSIKSEVLRNHFKTYLEHLDLCMRLPTNTFKYMPEEVYSKLDQLDKELAAFWAGDEGNNDFNLARMISARGAEKVAIKVYQSIGYKVKDVSRTQPLTRMPFHEKTSVANWKLYDLKLNDGRCIDVKNARTPVNNKKRYTEHCVSRFKQERVNEDVIIAGILSPYLNTETLAKLQDEISYDINPILYLGETSLSTIRTLEKRFNYEFLKISIDGKHLIPEWAFEYPKKLYENRDKSRQELRRQFAIHDPSVDEYKAMGINPIPTFLACGLKLKKEWIKELTFCQLDFYQRMRPWGEKDKITLPHLFLALLVHFLDRVIKDKDVNNYNPMDYRKILYPNYSHFQGNLNPLGIYDPLEIIDSFIETLIILWSNRYIADLSHFSTFRFRGIGILEGWRRGEIEPVTILAYCGGFVDGKGKCGFSPLIIGSNKTCNCGKLICNQCGYCSKSCSEGQTRMQNHKPDQSVDTIFHRLSSE